MQLNSSSDNQLSGSTSAGIGRRQVATDAINYQNSNYQILENRKTTAGEWNSVIGSTMSNSLRVTYSSSDEGRPQSDVLFPFVDILQGGTAYISFGSEPFTPNNELRYNSFEVKNDFTKFGTQARVHVRRPHRALPLRQRVLQLLQAGRVGLQQPRRLLRRRARCAGQSRTAPRRRSRSRYQNRYMNLPGLDKPSQPLTALYGGAYAQDDWRRESNLTITMGLRFDVPVFENTAYLNPNANALTFRDENGQPVQYDSGQMPGANILWSPRVGFNYDVAGDQKTQLRGGTGVFTGQPLVCLDLEPAWQHRHAAGQPSDRVTDHDARSRSRPTSTSYKPAADRPPAASYELNVTDNDFRFPQVWRSNIAVDRRLPGGITGTAEFIYNRDVNGIYYINANLPAAQTAYTGADKRRAGSAPPARRRQCRRLRDAHQQRHRQPW